MPITASTLIPLARLIVHPVAPDRCCRPKHYNAPCFADLLLDDGCDILAGPDVAVPPHGPAMLLQRHGNRFGARAIFPGVADKAVAHGVTGPGRVSRM